MSSPPSATVATAAETAAAAVLAGARDATHLEPLGMFFFFTFFFTLLNNFLLLATCTKRQRMATTTIALNNNGSRRSTMDGARDATHLEPLGMFFFTFFLLY